jgi:hypothetical protein
MRRISLAGAAAAMLLLIGAGCAATQKATVETGVQVEPGAGEAMMEAKGEAGVDVDATVDAILGNGEAEAMEQKKVEDEASDVNADAMELDAYSKTQYE